MEDLVVDLTKASSLIKWVNTVALRSNAQQN